MKYDNPRCKTADARAPTSCITDGHQHKRQYNSENNLDASEVYFVFQTYTDHTTPGKKWEFWVG